MDENLQKTEFGPWAEISRFPGDTAKMAQKRNIVEESSNQRKFFN